MDLVILTTHMEHAQTPKWRRVREQQWREVVDRVKDGSSSAAQFSEQWRS